MKKFALVCAIAVLAGATSVQAQSFSAFTADNNGAEFWDNISDDGLALNPNNCNSGFVVTGVAPTSCINQRPNTWLPYTGSPATSYWNIGGAWAPIIFNNGDYAFQLLGGTASPGCPVTCQGGDVAGADMDWGIFRIDDRSITYSFGTAGNLPDSGPVADPGTFWGIYVDLFSGGRAYSDTDRQFVLFGFANDPTTWIVGIEDNARGDFDYQDMLFRLTALDGGTPQEVVPEPATMTLLATGLAGMAAARRRKQAK